MAETTPAAAGVDALWDRQADWYDRTFDELSGDAHAQRARFTRTVELAGVGPGDALDAGMGPGRLCGELAAHGWTVSGIDVSAEMVAIARRRVPEAAGRLFEGSIEALPFADASFDLVTATGVLEYTVVPTAISQVARVLRPGGRAVVSYPNPDALYRMWKSWVFYPVVRGLQRAARRPSVGRPQGAPAISPRSFEALLAAAGLAAVRRELTSAQPVVAPLDTLFPRAAARVGRLAEGARFGRRLIATQVVYVAMKPER